MEAGIYLTFWDGTLAYYFHSVILVIIYVSEGTLSHRFLLKDVVLCILLVHVWPNPKRFRYLFCVMGRNINWLWLPGMYHNSLHHFRWLNKRWNSYFWSSIWSFPKHLSFIFTIYLLLFLSIHFTLTSHLYLFLTRRILFVCCGWLHQKFEFLHIQHLWWPKSVKSDSF